MFEWLSKEMASIRTHKFFLMSGPLTEQNRILLRRGLPELPPSYLEFADRFGRSELYRQSGIYLVRVFAPPALIEHEGIELVHFGRTDISLSYFKRQLLAVDRESPVFEWYGSMKRLQKTAECFEDWLVRKCKAARRRFRSKVWRAIQEGPPPFSDEEKRIVDARLRFHWRVVGIADNGDIMFEVHNGSNQILPMLTVGIRRRGTVDQIGAAMIPVGALAPGQSASYQVSCYKRFVPPSDIEPFELPDPGPEDRFYYREFMHSVYRTWPMASAASGSQ